MIKINFTCNSAPTTPLSLLLELLQVRLVLLRADGPHWQTFPPDPIQQGGPQTEVYTSFKIRACLQGIRIKLINYTFGKIQSRKHGLPSTRRACAVYRKSSTISRMTVGNGNLRVLDCSLDCQVRGKASIWLITMQTTLATQGILYYSSPPSPANNDSDSRTNPFKTPVLYRTPAYHTALETLFAIKELDVVGIC